MAGGTVELVYVEDVVVVVIGVDAVIESIVVVVASCGRTVFIQVVCVVDAIVVDVQVEHVAQAVIVVVVDVGVWIAVIDFFFVVNSVAIVI